MVNAITVDVEEYFHAANLEAATGPRVWHKLPSRVEASTRELLELFAKHNVKGTFFVLGYVARRHPGLIREIAAAGHEIASHGYGHRIAYTQTPRQFARDVIRSKHLLEDLIGSGVYGYRAPNFSIQSRNEWAYDELIRAGYRYDSSLFPVRHPRYSNVGASRVPFVLHRPSGSLYIFPLAVYELSLFGRSFPLPVAGGAYWRLFPIELFYRALKSMNEREKLSGNCYLHPWEIDPGQPYYSELRLQYRLRHYTGAAGFTAKLDYLFTRLRFGRIRDLAVEYFGEDVKQVFGEAA